NWLKNMDHSAWSSVCSGCVISQDGQEILVTHDPAFATRPESLATKTIWYKRDDLVFGFYGDFVKQMRKICVTELLSGKNVRSFTFIRQDENSKLINTVRSAQGRMPVNVTKMMLAYTSSMVCRAAFGRVLQSGRFFPSLEILPVITGLKRKWKRMHHEMDDILDDVIKQHQGNRENGKVGNAESGDEDIIDVLLRLQESGNLQVPITTRNIKALLLDIFNAGTDNSSVTVQWAMSELMRQPNLIAKARDEVRQICEAKRTIEEADMEKLKYLKMVIHETLRLHPPTPIIPRLSMENRVVSGYTIPDKTQIIVNAWAIGRDPEYWDDAENFKPERFDLKSIDYFGSQHGYFPFGLGRRMCPGITFGLANVELPLAHLLYHFDLKLPDGMEPAEESEGLTVQRKNNLFLIATPYDPSSDR
ncbi:unnamed protein product, partial [Coffea canephora]